MEGSLNQFVKKLIEVDCKAVELADKREKEIEALEQRFNLELQRYNNNLEAAAKLSCEKRKEALKLAEAEIQALRNASDRKLQKMKTIFDSQKARLADEIWKAIIANYLV